MNWVIAIATAVQAIAAVVLIRFTIIALRTSEAMAGAAARQVAATQEQMCQSSLPSIAFEIDESPMKNVRTGADMCSLMVSNVGVGPALDLVIRADTDAEILELQVNSKWSRHALAAGDRKMAYDFSLTNNKLILERASKGSVHVGRINVRYADVYGRPGELHADVRWSAKVPPDDKRFAFALRSYRVPGGEFVMVEVPSASSGT